MPKRMIPAPPTKFRVGERFILNMGENTGWASWDGRRGFVLGPPEFRDAWDCGSVDGSRESGYDDGGWRYPVLVEGRQYLQFFCEEHMRKPLQEHMRKPRRQRASTWDRFEKATGLRLDKPLVTVMPTQKSQKHRHRGSGAQHG